MLIALPPGAYKLPLDVYPFSVLLCPAASLRGTTKSPTSVELPSLANGNLSIVLTASVVYPPDVYPCVVDDWPPGDARLACVTLPTSVALLSLANGNLLIVVTIFNSAPAEVYPLLVEECPAKPYLFAVKSPTSVALSSLANGNLSIVAVSGWPPDV